MFGDFDEDDCGEGPDFYMKPDKPDDPISGREYCPRCSSGPRQREDVDECPDCGRKWDGPRLLDWTVK